jgi:DNA polymerase IV
VTAPHRRILLIDADAFFVAVARLVDPDGAGRAPLLIVGGAPGGRGVVCSASYETRAYGVRSAMPISRALKLCPDAMCVPVPGRACGEKSREIRLVLNRFSPVVQAASIDEWYMDLGGTEALYEHAPLADLARRIRQAVIDETGLTVSIGGATSRLVAKLAVEMAKPHRDPTATGVHVVDPGTEAAFLRRFALGDFPGVGPRFRERLEHYGLRTVPDLLAQDRATLSRWLGERAAQWLLDRAQGVDESAVRSRDVAKSLSHEDTFAENITSDDVLEAELLRLVVRVGADLRDDGLAARTITVKIRDSSFRTRSAGRTLPHAVVTDRVIFATARALLRRLRRGHHTPTRLLGVALSGLGEPDADAQLALFEDPPSETAETSRDRKLAAVVDRVRAKYGKDALLPARLSRD